MKAALYILRYLYGSFDVGVFYSNSPDFFMDVYCNSDRATCPDTRRSVIGFCVQLGDSLISWKAKKQPVVSLFSFEAEYRFASKVVAELVWLRCLFADFGVPIPTPVPVYGDNQAAIHIARDLVFHECTKHIEVDCHFIRTLLGEELIEMFHVPTAS